MPSSNLLHISLQSPIFPELYWFYVFYVFYDISWFWFFMSFHFHWSSFSICPLIFNLFWSSECYLTFFNPILKSLVSFNVFWSLPLSIFDLSILSSHPFKVFNPLQVCSNNVPVFKTFDEVGCVCWNASTKFIQQTKAPMEPQLEYYVIRRNHISS